jgi:hypothetical protein
MTMRYLTATQYEVLCSFPAMAGMARQLELAANSGIEYCIQTADNSHRVYQNLKAYQSERSAQDFYYNLECPKKGKKRLVKRENTVLTVIYEHSNTKPLSTNPQKVVSK